MRKIKKTITLLILYILLFSSILHLLSIEEKIEVSPEIKKEINENIKTLNFNGTRAYNYTEILSHNFTKRYVGSKEDALAADWFYDNFVRFGLDTTYQNFTTNDYNGEEGKGINIIGKSPGETDESILFIAHRDIIVTTFQGANDNGGGCGILLELARSLSKTNHYYTYIFVSSDAEETGLHGAKHLSKEWDSIDKIKCVIAIDMCTWKDAGNRIELYAFSHYEKSTNSAYLKLAKIVGKETGAEVGISPKLQIFSYFTLTTGTTDSEPFVEHGIPSFGIGDSDMFEKDKKYPDYHTFHDTMRQVSEERFWLVGNFTQSYVKSINLSNEFEKEEVYLFRDEGFISENNIQLHLYLFTFSFFLIIILALSLRLHEGWGKISSSQDKIYTLTLYSLILSHPFLSILFILILKKLVIFGLKRGEFNPGVFILFILFVQIYAIILIFKGKKIAEKVSLIFTKNEGKFCQKTALYFISMLLLTFIILLFSQSIVISIILFGMPLLFWAHLPVFNGKTEKELGLNLIFAILPQILLILVLSLIFNNIFGYSLFLKALPGIVYRIYGFFSFFLAPFLVAISALNVHYLLNKRDF